MWYLLTWLQPFVVMTGFALAVAAVRSGGGWRSAAVAQAAAGAASALGLAVYVAGEDHYRRGGISRWDAYDAHEVTVGALVVAATTTLALLAAVALARRRIAVGAALGSSGAAALTFFAFFANSLN